MVTAQPMWPSVLALAAALVAWPPPGALVAHRLTGLQVRHGSGAGAVPGREQRWGTAARWRARMGPDPEAAVRRRRVGAAAVGLATGLVVGGVLGLFAAVAVAVAADRLLRRTPDERDAVRRSLRHELPGACDLLGVCLGAGLPVGGALAAVESAVPAPLGPQLGAVAALYRLGAEPRRAWAEAPPELAALGRVLVRAGESGSSAVPALRALAADARTAARSATEAAVSRAGVWILAPLGLCFLPAFICLGVVPLVLGIAGDVFR